MPSFTGFVNGDTTASLSTQPTCTTTATAATAAGSTATASCTGAASNNYAISYVAGTVTVTQATVTLTLTASASKITAGQAVTLTITATVSTPAALPLSTLFNILNTNSGAPGTSVGTAQLADGNATTTVTLSTAGSYSLQAVFSPTTDFSGAESNPVPVQVVSAAGSVSGGFTMSATPKGVNTAVITLTPTGHYQASVALSCTQLPDGHQCDFFQNQAVASTVSLDGSDTPVQVGLALAATKPSGAFWLGSSGGRGLWLWFLLGLAAVFFAGLRLLSKRKHRLAWSMAFAGIMLASCDELLPPTTSTTITVVARAKAAPNSGYSDQLVTQQVTLQYTPQ